MQIKIQIIKVLDHPNVLNFSCLNLWSSFKLRNAYNRINFILALLMVQLLIIFIKHVKY